MRRRIPIPALFSLLALIMIVTPRVLGANFASDGDIRDPITSRPLAQASPVAGTDAEEGFTIVIVESDREGEFEFDYSGQAPPVGGRAIWSNESSVTHDLRITIQGRVTSTVEIAPEESYLMQFHEAGAVRFECILHGEKGSFEIE